MKKQLVICGFARSGSTLLYNMLRHSASKVFSPDVETPALKLLSVGAPEILSKRPLDVFTVQELYTRNAGRKDIRLILTVRDPRALISSKHANVPVQWFQGYDHCFLVLKDSVGYSNPGVLDTHTAVVTASHGPFPALVCRFEDLILDPLGMQGRIADFSGFRLERPFADFYRGNIPQTLRGQLNGVRAIEPGRTTPWLLNKKVAERVVRQFRLAPELFNVLEYWGYEKNRDWFDQLAASAPRGLTDAQGTIVSFFTEGTRYAHEAERLALSVKRFGLPVDIRAVPNLGSWIENVRYKGRFLAEARAKLRGPLLWIDADAVIHADPWPYLAGYDADLAVATAHDTRVISGTILLNDTPGCLAALAQWNNEIAADHKIGDQIALERAVAKAREIHPKCLFQVQYLPPSLCYVFDITKKELPYAAPIIEHLIASREGRRRGRTNQEMLAGRRARVAEIETNIGITNLKSYSVEPQDHDLNPNWPEWLLQEGTFEMKRVADRLLGRTLTRKISRKIKVALGFQKN